MAQFNRPHVTFYFYILTFTFTNICDLQQPRVYLVRSVDSFLCELDVSFASEIRLPVLSTGSRNRKQFVCGQTAGNRSIHAVGDEQEVGVNDSIFARTAIFLLPVSALAPIRDVICSTGGHTSFLHSVDPFLGPKRFERQFCLRNTTSGFKNWKQIPDVVCLPFSHLISSLINQCLVALSLSLTINTSVDNQ